MKEKIKNILISENNSVFALCLFLILSAILFLEAILQLFGFDFINNTAGVEIAKILYWTVNILLFLIPVSFLALLVGSILGNKDHRHLLLMIILGLVLTTTVIGNILTSRSFGML